ncbi:MAG: glycosyltransferase [Anaerolineae bacterium]|nr:glycosyltransferase [Anaerolineae bacterium]
MRVVMLSKACIVGAYQRKLEEMAALPDVDLTVLVPPFWREGGRELTLERAHTRGYTLEVLPMILNGHFHLHFYPTLARELRRLRPEVFHIDEEPYNLSTYLALRHAQALGCRALFFTWQNLLRRYPPPFRNMERYVLRHANWALVGNEAAEAVLRQKGYRGRTALIPQFGVDPEIYRPLPEVERPGTPFVVGYAGRLVPAKGVLHLLEALAGLEGDWRLEIAGSGPLQEALESRARELGVRERVSFSAHLPSLEMPRFYNRLHALVLPSLTMSNWQEQFGRVLIEAMACGVPVVGSSSGEIPNVIGDAGLTFREGDVAALRLALQRLYDSPALREELARRGRRRVEERYTQARIAAATVEVYRQLLRQTE